MSSVLFAHCINSWRDDDVGGQCCSIFNVAVQCTHAAGTGGTGNASLALQVGLHQPDTASFQMILGQDVQPTTAHDHDYESEGFSTPRLLCAHTASLTSLVCVSPAMSKLAALVPAAGRTQASGRCLILLDKCRPRPTCA